MPSKASAPFHDEEGEVPPEIVIHAIVRVMRENRDDEDLVKRAIVKLRTLVIKYSTQMVEAGVIDEVIHAMQRHSSQEQVIQLECDVLFTIWLKDSPDKEHLFRIIAEATDACVLFVHALQSFPQNTQIQFIGASFLCFLVKTEDVVGTVLAEDGIAVLTHALSVCMVLYHGFCIDVSGAILTLIQNCGDIELAKEKIQEAGAISVLVDVIKFYAGSKCAHDGPRFAMRGLALLAVGDDDIKTAILELDVLPCILDAMLLHSTSTKFLMDAMHLVSQLVEGRKDIIDVFEAAGGVRALTIIMASNRDEKWVAITSASFLLALGNESPQIMVELVSSRNLSMMTSILSRHADSNGADLQQAAFFTLLAEAAARDKDTTPEEICSQIAAVKSSTTPLGLDDVDPFCGAFAILTAWALVSDVDESVVAQVRN